ncbi:hypothetical protein [Ehrlichia ruminantium]|uniref:hypothetical protein n=1 Tax=Ehrlichia ruminantium TaxID=779 RepID=UPI0015DCCCE8|nr:hypothetical protein [Ehrlichia ruminantium]QLK58154.1 hypothetical protein FDZ59_04070 [Ehrlichia ruminantium]UOD97720.1 hypothetical protein IMW64_04005 [Ehrlichia ruminantium]
MDLNKLIKRLVFSFVMINFVNRFLNDTESGSLHLSDRHYCYFLCLCHAVMGFIIVNTDGYSILENFMFSEQIIGEENAEMSSISDTEGGGESLVEENSSADGQVPGYMLQDSYIGLCVGHRFCSVDMRM